MHELYKKYRPKRFADLVAQPDAVKVLQGFSKSGKIPHATLLHGPSGCGKSTTAYILRDKLGCGDIVKEDGKASRNPDFQEINCANTRGIDTIRDIQQQMSMSPMMGKNRVWMMEECHALSRDAQTAFLVPLEQMPKTVYFILATTDPEKLLDTIRGRCTMVKFNSVSEAALAGLVKDVAKKEGKAVSDKLAEHIAEAAGGSAREALNFLDKVIDLEKEEDRFSAIVRADQKKAAFDVVRELLWSAKPTWRKLAEIISTVDDSNPEGLRHLVLTNARKELLKCDPRTMKRAGAVLLSFEKNWFDTKKNGLTISCWDCFKNLPE